MMDYKKSTAPTNTVNRDVMELCEETGNIYESVAIIAKRANQISADIKNESRNCRSLQVLRITLTKFSRTASRLKSAVSMRSFPSQLSWLLKSS